MEQDAAASVSNNRKRNIDSDGDDEQQQAKKMAHSLIHEEEPKSHQEVFCFGGPNAKMSEKMPTHVWALRGVGIKQICCENRQHFSEARGFVLTESNKLYQWGPDKLFDEHHTHRGITGSPLIKEPVLQIACGHGHTAAVSLGGNLYTWGIGGQGRIGHGDDIYVSEPKLVEGMAGISAKQVACGAMFTLALTHAGEVYSCGANRNGFTGHGTNNGSTMVPKKIQAFNEPVSQISSCNGHSAAISSSGNLYTWGWGKSHRLGHVDKEDCLIPTIVAAFTETKVVQVSCGFSHTTVVADNGSLFSFGNNVYGQLGHGDKKERLSPTLVKSLQNVVHISSGQLHTASVTTDGKLYTWGDDSAGQCGHGPEKDSLDCELVEALIGYKVTHVSAFPKHTIVLVDSSSFPPSDLPIHSVLNEKTNSDVTFCLENGSPIYAHHTILSTRSSYFQKLLGWGPSFQKEIQIKETNCREVFLLVMKHIYGAPINFESVSSEQSLELYGLSDVYQLLHLKAECLAHFKKLMSAQSCLALLPVMAVSPYRELKDICFSFIKNHIAEVVLQNGADDVLSKHFLTVPLAISSLKVAVSSTPIQEKLKSVCVSFLIDNEIETMKKMGTVYEVLGSELASDICAKVAKKMEQKD